MKLHRHPVQGFAGYALVAAATPLLWWAWQRDLPWTISGAAFVSWHNAMELIAVVVAMLVFVTGYRAIISPRRGAVVLLGLAFLCVGALDFLHTISLDGMSDATSTLALNVSTFFWLAARLIAACALVVYVCLPTGPDVSIFRKRLGLGMAATGVAAMAALGLRWPSSIPPLFVDEQGIAPLTIALDWLTVGIHAVTLIVLWLRRRELVQECLMALAFAVALSAVSVIFFTQIADADRDAATFVGHAYKVAAYLYLFHATFSESLRRPLDRLAAQHVREKVTLNAAPDGVLWVDQQGMISMVNPAMETLSGYTIDELIGQSVDVFLPPSQRHQHSQSMRGYFANPNNRAMGVMNLSLLRKDGQVLPVDISLGEWEDEGQRHAIAYIRDLTERKKFEESLRHQATHDELTGLPNRWLFRIQLGQELARSFRMGSRMAVMVLDLDDFKAVNDSFGHVAGDELLVQVGARIKASLRENDTLSRLGGDEFAILLGDLTNVDEATRVATKLVAALEEPFQLNANEIYSGVSLGIAFYPDDAADSETLLRYSDMAMYQAKQAGRGGHACYSQDMDMRVHEDMHIHSRLKSALEHHELQLYYQPQVDVQNGDIVGAEALLRWHDAELGQVSPAKFIPVAEATGLVLPLSDRVLDMACQQIATWQKAGTPLRVAVNISAQQFRQRDLPEKVAAALDRHGAHARWLDIEITESVAMTQPEQAREQLDALVALGCRIALDDFGTGYSSLSYLKTLPVSKLKIDRSFMEGIPEDSNDLAISRAIIALAHSLGMSLVAEGVETDAQLAFLRQYGCESYQGWLFAKAMPPRELERLLTGYRDLESDLEGGSPYIQGFDH